MKAPSLNQQIQELERELNKRASVYPRLVSKGEYRQSEVEYFVARLEAALATLKWLRANERVIKQRLGS